EAVANWDFFRWRFPPPSTSFSRRTGDRRSLSFGVGSAENLNCAGLLQRTVGAVLIDRLETASRHSDPNEFLQFRHPDPMLVQIGPKDSRHVLGHVPADTALFLRHATAVDNAPTSGSAAGDLTNLGHKKKPPNLSRL